MAATEIETCNRALTRIGAQPITSFGDGSAAALVAAINYEPIVRAELASCPWRFAMKQESLTLLAGKTLEDLYAWQIPPDALDLRRVMKGADPVQYDRLSDKIISEENEGLWAEYIWRAPEAHWPAYFADALVTRLEAVFWRSLADAADKSQAANQLADRAFALARVKDAQTRSARNPLIYDLVAARRA